jgi:hypothetical protein
MSQSWKGVRVFQLLFSIRSASSRFTSLTLRRTGQAAALAEWIKFRQKLI